MGRRGTESRRTRFSKVLIFVALCLCGPLFSAPLLAQQRLLTLDDLYGAADRVNFSGTPAPQLTWIDGGHYAWPRPQSDRQLVDWMSVAAATGETSPLFDAARAQSSLAATPGVAASTAARAVHSRDFVFNRAMTAALITLDHELFVLTFADARVKKLTTSGGDKEEATLSPDASSAAFVRSNNLFLVDVSTGREIAVTRDGSAKILNGKMDWVYEEEIYGRGTTLAYWWSPDSSHIAFLRIDDAPVTSYITLDDIGYDPTVETWPYPRAG